MACIAVYSPLLRPGAAPYSPCSDIVTHHLAIKQALFSSPRAGHGPPLWRDDQFAGVAALHQPQALYLHPLQVPFWWLRPEEAFAPSLVLALFVGALGAYAFSRALGHAWGFAILSGIAQLVCFKLVIAGYAGWSSVLATLVLLPWLAAAWLKLCKQPTTASMLGLAVVLSCVGLGLTPQTAYYLGLSLCGWPLLSVLAAAPGTRLGRALRITGLLAGAVLLALASTAALWLPLAAEWPWLARAEQGYSFFTSGHALSLRHLATLFDPEWLGTPLDRSYPGHELWEDVAYFGRVPLLGVAIALVAARALSRAERYLLLAWIFSIAASLESPLLRALYAWVPGYALFRLPGRMLFVSALLGIVLGMSGLRIAWSWLERRTSPRIRFTLATCVGVAMLIEGGWYARAYLQTRDARDLMLPTDHPIRALATRRDERVAIVGRATFNYGWAASAGISLVNGYDPYNYAHYKRYMTIAESGQALGSHPGNWIDLNQVARPDLLSELAVGSLLSMRPLANPRLQLIAEWPDVPNFVLYKGLRSQPLRIYRNPDVRARARFASEVIAVSSLDAIEQRLAREPLHGQAYVLAPPPAAPTPGSRATDPSSVTVVAAHPGHIRVRTRSGTRRLLVLAEDFHPGWRANVDGSPARVLQTNLTLLGVWVPAGDHQVVARFEPLHFALARTISTGGAFALASLLGWCLWRRRQRLAGS